jgi:pimeloyl-ACP methyl ester carboxylesterase
MPDILRVERRARVTAPALDDARWRHAFADVNGVRLHYVEAAAAGPLVVLLHGFPEFWYAWRRQILPLAAAGFRVVALDMRGYNLSGKPRAVSAYAVRTLVEDLHALILSLGSARAHLVGHDWGAGVAWAFAMRHPEALARLAILNGPHPINLMKGLLNPLQLARSWYMFFFQLPRWPEYVARRNGYAVLLEPFRRLPARARWEPYEYEAYVEAFEQPGALRAMINYYRAMFRPGGAVSLRPIDAEVLILWGEQDAYLGRALARPNAHWVRRARVEYFPGAGHFIQHEAPELVNDQLIRFLSSEDHGASVANPPPLA